ncbi:ISL3 family transposase [Massilicoli timonensis]|nr:ISL3 family transposase [Massilicoli timonensis]
MNDFITDLFNIDRKKIKKMNVVTSKDKTEFHIVLNHDGDLFCPFCYGVVHANGYSKPKIINHPKLTDRKAVIIFYNHRYQCNECLRTFSGKNPFTFSNFRNSYLSFENIMKQLSNLNYSYKMVAELNHISPTQVQRYFDSFVNIPRITLPESIGIDEIHSKMAKRKDSAYLCVMVDNKKRSLFEILPSRSKAELKRYFEKIPQIERNNVKYVTIDMWFPYKEVANKYFPNCIVAVDPFHVVEHLMTSFRRIRLNIMYQVEYGSDSYYLLKTWKDLIEKNVFLDNEPVYNNRFKMKLNKRQLLDLILEISETLALGYHLKEMYLTFNKNATEENCEEWFNSILEAFKKSGISEFHDFIQTLENWKPEILNSFKRPFDEHKLSNALCENINGQIRTYLSVSKGVSNFIRFRKRCIFALNPKVFYSITNQLKSNKVQGKRRGKYNKNK